MTFLQKSKSFLISLLAIVLITSCAKEEDASSIENSLVNVNLKATQTQLDKFNIEILDVQLRVLEDETDSNAWISLNATNTGIHDLTNFTGNQSITLVDFEQVPAKFIYSIKIVFGDENTVVRNNVEYVVDIDSEYDHTSVNIIDKQLVESKLYEFTILFDTDESIKFSSYSEAKLYPKTNIMMRLYNLF